MISRRSVMVGAAAGLAGCSAGPEVYSGPQVTRIQVLKGQRTMQLLHQNQLLREFRFQLGFSPEGHKVHEGDGRTPEGSYLIDRRNPNSRYHLSLGISYPNANDVAYARSQGLDPGGDIFIHGTPDPWVGKADWTWGCIAISNKEMDDVYAMVQTGTLVTIYA
ncbi:L,D-transpeptidase family protein [Yoonia maritima]|uniref:L,D-transpeptidase family protein n=1 Tax=Yoonia maritima TaxID=1435347 RepID=UPI000D0FAED8|nr:L,D-transpeptidase family protein [Yoonia maritima]